MKPKDNRRNESDIKTLICTVQHSGTYTETWKFVSLCPTINYNLNSVINKWMSSLVKLYWQGAPNNTKQKGMRKDTQNVETWFLRKTGTVGWGDRMHKRLIAVHTCNPGSGDTERSRSQAHWPTSLGVVELHVHIQPLRRCMILEVGTQGWLLSSVYTHINREAQFPSGKGVFVTLLHLRLPL